MHFFVSVPHTLTWPFALSFAPARMKQNCVHDDDDDILFYHGALKNLLVICISVQLDKNITNSLHYISYSTDTGRAGAQAVSPSLPHRRSGFTLSPVHVGFVEDTGTGT